MMCKVAKRYCKSPFDSDFLEQWSNFERRSLLIASLEIDTDSESLIKILIDFRKLFIDVMDIVGTSLFNVWVKPRSRIKHLLKSEKGRSTTGKMKLPDGRVINIIKRKD